MINPAALRMADIPPSNIREVFDEVTRLRNAGREVVPFHIGQPDFDTPAHIKQAAKQALDDGLVQYTANAGLPELRRAIADKLAADNGITVDADKGVIVTVGANEAILLAMLAYLNPGDEVLIPDPMWLHYLYCARIAGASVASLPLRPEDGFLPDPDEIRRRITPRTRMLVINSPHNPTGVVYPRALLQDIARIVAEHGLLLVSDEIYEKILFDGCEHVSPASFDGMSDFVLTVNGFSKAYAMTGWRLGYIAGTPELLRPVLRVHQYTTVCATSFAQAGAVAALRGSQDALAHMVAEFDRRRQALVAGFQSIPGCSLVTPQGAFYAFPRLPEGANSAQVSRDLLQGSGVAVVPGAAFGEYGEGYVRIAYSCSLPAVERGVALMRDYFSAV